MKITQISIFLENKKGRLAEVCRLFGQKGINMRALTVAESEQYGVLRVVVDKTELAIEALKEQGFVAKLTDIVAVEVEDRPGGLAAILDLLSEAGINIEYMYAFVEKHTDKALLVFRFANPDAAISLLSKNGISVVGNKDIVQL